MKQISKKGSKNQIGAIGEQIAAKHLKKQGFSVLDTNYLKKWGEIDIVARETGNNVETVRFVEVKAVSYETKQSLEQAVARGTWRPEENVHASKLKRLHRAIDTWISEHNYDGHWEIDVMSIRIVPREKYATVKYIKNVIL